MRKEMNENEMEQVVGGLINGEYYTVTDTKNYLALRNDCKYDDSNEIARLHNGQKVQIIATGENGYVMVDPGIGPGIVGYVNEKYLK